MGTQSDSWDETEYLKEQRDKRFAFEELSSEERPGTNPLPVPPRINPSTPKSDLASGKASPEQS